MDDMVFEHFVDERIQFESQEGKKSTYKRAKNEKNLEG